MNFVIQLNQRKLIFSRVYRREYDPFTKPTDLNLWFFFAKDFKGSDVEIIKLHTMRASNIGIITNWKCVLFPYNNNPRRQERERQRDLAGVCGQYLDHFPSPPPHPCYCIIVVDFSPR